MAENKPNEVSTRAQVSRLRFIRVTRPSSGSGPSRKRLLALYECQCGTQKEFRVDGVKGGKIRSCGCLTAETAGQQARKHGESKWKDRPNSPEYSVWQNMRDRCNNRNRRNFKDYGARGITICERWNSYENFLFDMGRKPTPDHELEREDNDKGYSPDNCRWATRLEQMRNQRKTRFFEHDGLRLSLSEWVEISGIPRATILRRIELGWPVGRALREPIKTQFRHKGK